jgi:hypothetical protein
MLSLLAEDLWVAEGSIVSFMGFDYPTRMVVVRLLDGGLWLWSPIKLSPELVDSVVALGPVRHLVSPSSLHYFFLAEWHERFPEAKVWGPRLLFSKCPELPFQEPLTDVSPCDWRGQIDQFYFDNSRIANELIFFHRRSRTALIAELSQTFTEDFLSRHWPWWLRWIAKLSKMTEGHGKAPLDYRISFRRRSTARPKVRALIGEHPERVVVAHGEIVRSRGEAFLRSAFSWLL